MTAWHLQQGGVEGAERFPENHPSTAFFENYRPRLLNRAWYLSTLPSLQMRRLFVDRKEAQEAFEPC